MPNLLSTYELNRAGVEELFETAEAHRTALSEPVPIDATKQGASLFFESSTRTRIGFEAAAWQLGVKTVAMYETKVTENMSAAESISDTVRTLNPLVNYFAIRHPSADIFEQVVPYTEHPVINCGSGDTQHPTQALIDSYAMLHKFNTIDGLNITMTGALRHSRAARSLLGILTLFDRVTLTGFTETELNFTEEEIKAFTANGTNSYAWTSDIEWGKEQIVYSSGFPPKNASGTYDQATRDQYKITVDVAKQLAGDSIIMNPLPRIDEIDHEVDSEPQAYYFKQNELALSMRKAVLSRYCL